MSQQAPVTPESYILKLPTELLEICLEACLNANCLDVRKVCKTFGVVSRRPFGKIFLRNLSVILHPESFQTLMDITSNEEFARCVEIVTIGCQRAIGGTGRSALGEWKQGNSAPEKLEKAFRWTPRSNALEEAFRSLPSLVSVEVIGDSYFLDSDFEPSSDLGPRGLRCGENAVKISIQEHKCTDIIHDYTVFHLVFHALHNSGVYTRITIDLDPPNGRQCKWSFESKSWEACASSVRRFTVVENLNDWKQSILLSMPNLEHLCFFYDNFTFFNNFTSHNNFTVYRNTWSNLNTIQLVATFLACEPFVEFLEHHQNSLKTIELENPVMEPHGTWEQPLELMCRMPNLTALSLSKLYARSPILGSEYDRDHEALRKKGREEIVRALKSNLSDLQTMRDNRGDFGFCLVRFK